MTMSDSDVSLDMSVMSSDFEYESSGDDVKNNISDDYETSGDSSQGNGSEENGNFGIQPYMFEPSEPVVEDDTDEGSSEEPAIDTRMEEKSW
jgi:hypothetical protein